LGIADSFRQDPGSRPIPHHPRTLEDGRDGFYTQVK